MTSFEIDILMHYATRADDHPLIGNPPPIWRSTIDKFLAYELLTHADEGAATCYVATDRLRAYVDALTSMPLPVKKWLSA